MNAKCIYANLQHFNLLNSANISEAYSITIQILNNPNIYIFNDQLLQISYEYVKISLEEWYNQQVEKIVNKSFSITDLINIMNNSPYNPYV